MLPQRYLHKLIQHLALGRWFFPISCIWHLLFLWIYSLRHLSTVHVVQLAQQDLAAQPGPWVLAVQEIQVVLVIPGAQVLPLVLQSRGVLLGHTVPLVQVSPQVQVDQVDRVVHVDHGAPLVQLAPFFQMAALSELEFPWFLAICTIHRVSVLSVLLTEGCENLLVINLVVSAASR